MRARRQQPRRNAQLQICSVHSPPDLGAIRGHVLLAAQFASLLNSFRIKQRLGNCTCF